MISNIVKAVTLCAALWLTNLGTGDGAAIAGALEGSKVTPHRVMLSITEDKRSIAEASLPGFDPDQEMEVPFTSFSTGHFKARLFMQPSALLSFLEIDQFRRISFPRKGVPLKLVEVGDGRFAIFFREAFSDKLFLYTTDKVGMKEYYLRGRTTAELIFRQAGFHRGQLHAVLYDNIERANHLVVILDDNGAGFSAMHFKEKLPSVDDPGGANYELIPSIFMLSHRDTLWVAGGSFVRSFPDRGTGQSVRLPSCLRVQEFVLSSKGAPVALCVGRDRTDPPFSIVRWRGASGGPAKYDIPTIGSVVWGIQTNGDEILYRQLRSSEDVAEMLHADLINNHASGVMELGSSNTEGRVPWSQIYFLNGLLDLIYLSRRDGEAFERFQPLLADVKRRLDLEMYLINRLLQTDQGYLTQAFTIDRSPTLFAVQTSRLVLLFNRYSREISNGAALTEHAMFVAKTLSLAGHIDVITRSSPQMKSKNAYLHWPKGSAAYFDGLNLPYNHQNEWAYAVADTLIEDPKISVSAEADLGAAGEMIDEFLIEVAPKGVMPRSGKWPYWWGRARDAWTAKDAISVHTPAYPGDKLESFISFRTIDVMSVLGAQSLSERARDPRLAASIERLVSEGNVYPFAASAFAKNGFIPRIDNRIVQHYARLGAPWDMQSAVWSLAGAELLGSR